jgi:hypothetical protein
LPNKVHSSLDGNKGNLHADLSLPKSTFFSSLHPRLFMLITLKFEEKELKVLNNLVAAYFDLAELVKSVGLGYGTEFFLFYKKRI